MNVWSKLLNKENLLEHEKLKCCQKVKINFGNTGWTEFYKEKAEKIKTAWTQWIKRAKLLSRGLLPLLEFINFYFGFSSLKEFCLKKSLNLGLMWSVEAKWGFGDILRLNRCWEKSKTTQGHPESMNFWGQSGRKGFLMLDSVIMTACKPESISLIKADALKE